MHTVFEKMKWDDIYSYWRMSAGDELSVVNRVPLPCKIPVQGNGRDRIYAHLWLKNNQIEQSRNEMNHSAEYPFYHRNSVLPDERVIKAADLMVQAKSEEERAAIWIWIFCSSLENAKLPYPNNLYLDYVGAKARIFLQEHFQEWVFRYHHRFPRLFVDAKKLSKFKFERYSVIIDFALINAYMICKDYSIILFDSEPEVSEPPFSYLNLRKE